MFTLNTFHQIALPFHLWMKNTINKIFMKLKRVRQVGPKLKNMQDLLWDFDFGTLSFLCSILSAVFIFSFIQLVV